MARGVAPVDSQEEIRPPCDGRHIAVGQFRYVQRRTVSATGVESMRSPELADYALAAATIIVMLALLLVSMPG